MPSNIVNIPVSLSMLGLLVQQKPFSMRVIHGVPASANVIAAVYDPYRGVLVITVEDASFAPVPDGELIPEQAVTVQTFSV